MSARHTRHKKSQKGIKILLIGVGVIAFLLAVIVIAAYRTAALPAKVVNDSLVFQNKLTIPSLLEPEIQNGEKIFAIKVQEGQKEIVAGRQTKTLGFNGSFLGPSIRVNKGDVVRIKVTNMLNEATTVHWHGMQLPASMDGGPHQVINPKQVWEPQWTVSNEAATLWYHPHLMGKTGEQVYRGLAGLFIIDDTNSASLDLPQEYGKDDIPLIIQDKKFDATGQLIYDHNHMMHRPLTAGFLGDTILVNGTYAPFVEVPAKLIRLRILNGSNARRFNFGFADKRTFYQIATDGGLLPAPVERKNMQLSSGERAEILVDISETKKPITLISYPVAGDENTIRNFMLGVVAGETDERQQFNVLELRPQPGEYKKQAVAKKLNTISYFDPARVTQNRLIRLDALTINNKKMSTTRVDEILRKGAIELWTVRNESPISHPFHIHGVQFQILKRDGMTPPLYEQGWKDTIAVDPEESVKLIMKVPDFTDTHLSYMYHCHILEHEDMGMMGQFIVVDKDTKNEDISIQELDHRVH